MRRTTLIAYLLAFVTFVSMALTSSLMFSGMSLLRIVVWLSDPRVIALDFVAGLPFACAATAFFLAHEMGHYLTCRFYGIRCTPPFFIPAPLIGFGTFGAVILIRERIQDRRRLFDMAVAGPLAGFVVALACVIYGVASAQIIEPSNEVPPVLFGRSLLIELLVPVFHPGTDGLMIVGGVYLAGWLGLLATAMNLVPAGQFDGGHIVYSLTANWHRAISICAGLFLLTLATTRLLVFGQFSAWSLWALIVLILGRRHAPLVTAGPPLGRARILIALLALVILVLSFMPHPVEVSL